MYVFRGHRLRDFMGFHGTDDLTAQCNVRRVASAGGYTSTGQAGGVCAWLG